MYQETKLAQTSISSINSIKTWQQRVVNEIFLQVKEVCEKCPGVLVGQWTRGKNTTHFPAPACALQNSWSPWASIQLSCQQTYSKCVVQARSSASLFQQPLMNYNIQYQLLLLFRAKH